MSSYNERLEWEYQDYLKQRYEEQQAAGYDGVRKIVCGGCGRVFYTTIYTKKYCHSPLLQQCLSAKRLSKTCYRCCKCSK